MAKRYPASVSGLKSWTRCSEQWWIEKMHKPRIPRSPAAWTARGIALHDGLMEWELSERTLDVENYYLEKYNQTINEFLEETPDEKNWTLTPRVKNRKNDIQLREADGLVQIQKYIERVSEEPWEIYRFPETGKLAVELPFEIDLVNPDDREDILPVRGSADMVIEYPDGTLRLRDIKTGNKETDNRQLKTYGWALAKEYGLYVSTGEYWYTKSDSSGGRVKLNWNDDIVTRIYFAYADSIKLKLHLPNPSDKNCGFCPKAVKELCPEGK